MFEGERCLRIARGEQRSDGRGHHHDLVLGARGATGTVKLFRLDPCDGSSYGESMSAANEEVEVVFEAQPEGGFTVYSPDLPGMVTEGGSLEEATTNAREAIELYVGSMRERGKQVPLDVVRRKFAMPA